MSSSRSPKVFKFILPALLFSAAALADGSDVKVLMHKFYSTFSDLKPYVLSEKKFKQPGNKKIILNKLDQLIGDSSEGSEKLDSAAGFRVTYKMLKMHFKEIRKGVHSGATDYARYKLKATMSLCIACHSRLPKSKDSVGLVNLNLKDKQKKLNFIQTEYLFLTKEFDSALENYSGLISGYPENNLSQPDLYKSFDRKLAIFTRIKRDPMLALNSLSQDFENSKLPMHLRRKIKSWLISFNKWAKNRTDYSKLNDKELVKKVSQPIRALSSVSLDYINEVEILYLSGLLYQRVFTRPQSKKMPEMLYLLSLSEQYLKPLHDYSLALIYQKECVIKYPRSKYAKMCLTEYKKNLKAMYQPLPQFLKESIDSLEGQLKSADRSKN